MVQLINQVTLLAIVLTGAALIREREHGTIEHLLVMPVTPLQIVLSKVWSMGLVVLAAAGLSMLVVFPLEMLSGGRTPRESMPQFVQWIMLAAPTTYFVALGQAVLFRGAGLAVIWPH